jgi:hypothetical protein
MSKQNKRKPLSPRSASTASTKKASRPVVHEQATTPSSQKNRFISWLSYAFGFKSILIGIAIALGCYVVLTKNNAYVWVREKYLKNNWEYIQTYRHATNDEIMRLKIDHIDQDKQTGEIKTCYVDYMFWLHIRKNTPDTAVILFPEKTFITEKCGREQLTSKSTNRHWVGHAIYPRRVVFKDEAATDPYYSRVTHVAICAAHGYDNLDYEVQQRACFDVLPKKTTNN